MTHDVQAIHDDLTRVDALAVRTAQRLEPLMTSGSPMYFEHLKLLAKPLRDLVTAQHLRGKAYYTHLLQVAATAV